MLLPVCLIPLLIYVIISSYHQYVSEKNQLDSLFEHETKYISEPLAFLESTAKADLEIHGANETHFAAMPPDAVFYPEDTQQVSIALAICHEHDCPVIPWGTGTSLEGV